MEKQNNAIEDLAFIRQVMQDAQRLAQCSPFSAFLWGSVILVAVGVSYLLDRLGDKMYISWVWFLLMPITAAIDHFHEYRQSREGISTLSQRILTHVSISLTVSLFLLTFVVGGAAGLFNDWRLYYIVVQVILGMGTFIFSGIYGLTGLKRLAIVLWVGSALLAFLPQLYVPLFFGLFVGVGFIGAGFMLRRFAESASATTTSTETAL